MMTRTTRSNHDRSPRVRLFGEEDASAMYKRQGWDPRKTREENMSAVDPFDRPEEEFDPSGYYDNEHGLSEAAETLADQGRGDDTEIAHVTPGELVIPQALQNPEVLAALRRAAAAHNIPLERLTVGNARNSINPETGAAEFDPNIYRYDGPDMEEIVVTTPREQGLVQLPQNLPNSGFYNYGTPGNGAAQYGVPAAMGVVGAVGHARQAAGAPPFGVGNMSSSDGSPYDTRHILTGDHSKGTGIDIRPIRHDGKQTGVTLNDPAYDRAATQKLVDQLRATGGVDRIFFNDPQITGASYDKGHDNHLHVRVNPSWKR